MGNAGIVKISFRSALAALALISLVPACGDDDEAAGGTKSSVAAGTEATDRIDRPVGLYMMDADGSNVKLLVPGNAFNPSWSPDGKRIAYQSGGISDYDSVTEIHVVNADGTGDVTLTDDPAFDTDPDWSAAGDRIVFSRGRNDGQGSRLWTMKADGSGETQVPPGSEADNDQPAWARAGDRIAFSRRLHTPQKNTNKIFVMKPDGTDVTDLGAADAFDPAWSADGTRIAYARMMGDLNSAIHVMNADGTSDVAITAGKASDREPAWSPDGSRVAFMSDRSGDVDQIWVMVRDGGGATQLSHFADLLETTAPVWSPDGKHILFARFSPS